MAGAVIVRGKPAVRRSAGNRVSRKATPEALILRAIRDGLTWRKIPHYRFNSGALAIPGKHGLPSRYFNASFAGCPDLMVMLPGSSGWIEVKSPRGRLSLPQQAFRDQCRCLGIPWLLARSWSDVEAWLP